MNVMWRGRKVAIGTVAAFHPTSSCSHPIHYTCECTRRPNKPPHDERSPSQWTGGTAVGGDPGPPGLLEQFFAFLAKKRGSGPVRERREITHVTTQ